MEGWKWMESKFNQWKKQPLIFFDLRIYRKLNINFQCEKKTIPRKTSQDSDIDSINGRQSFYQVLLRENIFIYLYIYHELWSFIKKEIFIL